MEKKEINYYKRPPNMCKRCTITPEGITKQIPSSLNPLYTGGRYWLHLLTYLKTRFDLRPVNLPMCREVGGCAVVLNAKPAIKSAAYMMAIGLCYLYADSKPYGLSSDIREYVCKSLAIIKSLSGQYVLCLFFYLAR